MKIKSIRAWKKDLGNTRPYTIAFKTVDEVANALVEIELENGIQGLGAGNPSKFVVGESLDDTMKALGEENLEFLLNRDILELYGILTDIQNRFPKNPAVRAALDIAVHDAFTRYLEVPLTAFLGQKIRSLPTSVTIGIKNVKDTLDEAKEYWDMGFKVLKVKTGKDVEEDIERMKKLREVYGDKILIRIDANQGYDESSLERFWQQTRNLDIELIEQPVPADRIDLLKALPAPLKEKIAADESLKSPSDAFKLLEGERACGIFNIKLMKSGGIYPARQIADLAVATDTQLMWGCNDESAISISAALHTALSFPNTKYLDLDGSLDLVEDVVSGGFTIEKGYMAPTGLPGLGVEKSLPVVS